MKRLTTFTTILLALVPLAISAVPVAAAGNSNVETLGPQYAEFDYWQEYSGWGPALYYEETVQVHYVALNKWTMTRKELDSGNWWVRQSLTQNGTAYVWNEDKTVLLDTQRFTVNELTIGEVTYLASWYHVYSFSYVDNYDYRWNISGIYHYWVKAKAGAFLEFAYWVKGAGTTVLWP